MTKQKAPQARHRRFRRMTKTIGEMIVDTRSFFEVEARDNKRAHANQPVRRTVACLRISEGLVKKASKMINDGDNIPSDDESETRDRPRTFPLQLYPTIRSTIFAMYQSKKRVLLDTLLAELQSQRATRSTGWVWSRSTLYRVLMHEMGFSYGDRPVHYQAVKEKHSIALQRLQYIQAICGYRAEGRAIFYQEETWVAKNMAPQKMWLDEEGNGGVAAPSGQGMRSIICHVGNENGFADGAALVFRGKNAPQSSDYHTEMNAEVFLDWVEKRVFPVIPPSLVIVIDRATYHTVLTDDSKPVKASFVKAEFAEWLVQKNIKYEIGDRVLTTKENYMTLKRVELVEICKQNKPKPKFMAQELAKKFDCDVLLLPAAHPELNPIEMIWANVKTYVANHNVQFSLADLERLAKECFSQIDAEEWRKYVAHCIQVEDNYYDTADGVPSEVVGDDNIFA